MDLVYLRDFLRRYRLDSLGDRSGTGFYLGWASRLLLLSTILAVVFYVELKPKTSVHEMPKRLKGKIQESLEGIKRC